MRGVGRLVLWYNRAAGVSRANGWTCLQPPFRMFIVMRSSTWLGQYEDDFSPFVHVASPVGLVEPEESVCPPDSDSPFPSLGEPDDSDSEVRARQFSDSSPAPSKPRLDKPASVGRSAAAAASASASVKVSGCLCHRHYTARLLLFCRPRLTMIDFLIYAPCLRPSVLHIPVSVAPARPRYWLWARNDLGNRPALTRQ